MSKKDEANRSLAYLLELSTSCFVALLLAVFAWPYIVAVLTVHTVRSYLLPLIWVALQLLASALARSGRALWKRLPWLLLLVCRAATATGSFALLVQAELCLKRLEASLLFRVLVWLPEKVGELAFGVAGDYFAGFLSGWRCGCLFVAACQANPAVDVLSNDVRAADRRAELLLQRSYLGRRGFRMACLGSWLRTKFCLDTLPDSIVLGRAVKVATSYRGENEWSLGLDHSASSSPAPLVRDQRVVANLVTTVKRGADVWRVELLYRACPFVVNEVLFDKNCLAHLRHRFDSRATRLPTRDQMFESLRSVGCVSLSQDVSAAVIDGSIQMFLHIARVERMSPSFRLALTGDAL
jgi:hypothetical protein